MGQIRKRGAYWYADLYVGSKRYRKRISKSKHLAELALKDLEVKAERNQLGFLERKEISLEDFIKQFLANSSTNNRPSTTNRYRSAIDNFLKFIKAETKVVRLGDVTHETIEKYKAWRKTVPVAKNGANPSRVKKPGAVRKGAKSYTVNFELTTIKTMFILAVKWKYLEASPAEGVKQLKAEDSKPRRFLTDAECDRLLRACEPEYRPIFFTLIHTGMRKAELLNLEWSDLDFKRRIIKIRRKSFWIPKAGEREIPMSDVIADVLDGLPRQSHFVFPDEDGEAMNGNFLRLQLIRIAKNAAIYNLTEVHALRHTFASQLLMRGVDLPTVQKLMGHSNIETTLIYSHQTTDHLREAVEKLSLGGMKTARCAKESV
ncbi:MAG: tyrosine-type recombinase/integrase [Candidatus Omnitrophota bacterium]